MKKFLSVIAAIAILGLMPVSASEYKVNKAFDNTYNPGI